jgi:hypothetical protein
MNYVKRRLKDRIGNHASMKPSALLTGSGGMHQRTPFGHVTLAGKAGDIKRLSCIEIFDELNTLDIYTQASAGSVIVSVTLADVDLALSPDQDAGDHWVVDHTAAPGAINKCLTVATVLKLEFLGDAIIYVSGV